MGSTFVIAEAGVNHNGVLDLALRLVDVAADAGADAVKFQTFRADRLVTRDASAATYQRRDRDAPATQHALLRALEMPADWHETLIARSAERRIRFLSTPFDLDSLDLLTGRFGLTDIKLSSGEITNAPLLVETARRARGVLLSTGMSTLDEVADALGALAFGFTRGDAPSRDAFRRALQTDAGHAALSERVTLLHCTSEYPAPVGDVNLRAMETMAEAFGLRVGLSDHTAGTHIAVAAVARGARVIEKHVTVDRALPGVDHAASLEPDEFARLVREIRDVERALGDGVKRPAPSELRNRDLVRRSLVAARDLRVGDHLDVTVKRPGTGVSPFAYWRARQRQSARNYRHDELIDASDAGEDQ